MDRKEVQNRISESLLETKGNEKTNPENVLSLGSEVRLELSEE